MDDDQLKKIIQYANLDEPDGSFTDNVMKMIEAEDRLSLHTLLPLLEKELIIEPPTEFSKNLMTNIRSNANKIAEPILAKRVKLVLSGIIFFILFLAFTSPSNLNQQHHYYFPQLVLNLSGAIIGVIRIASSFLEYLIPLSILLLIDYVFRIRQNQLNMRKQNH
jgi:hypothetical protein